MFKLKLILKYLLKRRIAWVSLVAVTLCTAMVLVVISVMGGWVDMFLELNHNLEGDVIVYSSSLRGISDYQNMIDQIRKIPEVTAAVPVIRTYGLLNVVNQVQREVQVLAYGDLAEVGKINSFTRGLYRQRLVPEKMIQDDPRLSPAQKQEAIKQLEAAPPSFDKPFPPEVYQSLRALDPNAADHQGMIVGTSLLIKKYPDGTDNREPTNLTSRWAQLTVVDAGAASTTGNQEVEAFPYWIVDDSKTGFYPVDSQTVYVPFGYLQKKLGMTQKSDDDGTVEPARTSEIEIAVTDRNNLQSVYAARDKIQAVVDAMRKTASASLDTVHVESWDEHQAEFIGAVENEKVLLTFLFGIISIVAIFLVFCIFFMIVVEKTRDIGIIKSVGATDAGVAQVFLGYGLVIGLVGAGTGLAVGYLIVHNINFLHAKLADWMGVRIWSADTYMFDTIPSKLNPRDTTVIVVVAILSALLGAVIPAWRASRMRPVESLRYE